MDINQLENFIVNELEPEEAGCFNFCIYWNPKHLKYRELFQSKKYQQCKDYILKHRQEISLESVSSDRKAIASANIEAMRRIRNKPHATIRLSDVIR